MRAVSNCSRVYGMALPMPAVTLASPLTGSVSVDRMPLSTVKACFGTLCKCSVETGRQQETGVEGQHLSIAAA